MSLVIPPGYANAAFIFSADFGTPPIVTTLGVDVSAFSGDFVEAANTAFTYWTNHMPAQMDAQLTLDRVTLAVGSDGPGGSVDSTLPPFPMARSGTAGPYSMSVIARKVTNTLGRRGRGRMFIPGALTGSEVDESGNVAPARVSSLQSSLDDLLADFVEGATPLLALPPVLLHSSAPTEPDPIVGLGVAAQVGWVRGRIR